MKKVLPAPLLSLALLVTWLMANGSMSVGHLLIGAALAIALPWFTERWRPDKPRLQHVGVGLRLAGIVLFDIVKSNVIVARLILGKERNIQPRLVWVPLTLRDPHGIVALASVITMTPGTLSAARV